MSLDNSRLLAAFDTGGEFRNKHDSRAVRACKLSLSVGSPRENEFATSIAFGDVESTGTLTREMEEFSLSNGAVFPTFLGTGKRGETSKPPRFTKSGQEPFI
jgi:hypothetical protein